MTLVELVLALGVIAIAVGCLIEVLTAASVGQQRLWNRERAAETARNIAERVIQCPGDWRALCADLNDPPNVAVTVQDGDGDPASGWAKVTARVAVPALRGGPGEDVTLVFGRLAN